MVGLLHLVTIIEQHLFQDITCDPIVIDNQHGASFDTRVQVGRKRICRVSHFRLQTFLNGAWATDDIPLRIINPGLTKLIENRLVLDKLRHGLFPHYVSYLVN